MKEAGTVGPSRLNRICGRAESVYVKEASVSSNGIFGIRLVADGVVWRSEFCARTVENALGVLGLSENNLEK